MSERLTTSAGPLPQLDANLGYLFRLAHQRFRALLESELEHLGLSAQEYGILSVFETRPELSTSELARIAQVTRQTIHAAILRLETAGLLERRARNPRVVLVGLTALRGGALKLPDHALDLCLARDVAAVEDDSRSLASSDSCQQARRRR